MRLGSATRWGKCASTAARTQSIQTKPTAALTRRDIGNGSTAWPSDSANPAGATNESASDSAALHEHDDPVGGP
jgi:hypothetical protein